MADLDMASPPLSTVDRYFDSAPRPDADVVEAGRFTLFVSRTPWSYYARPTLTHPEPATYADIELLADTCRQRHVALAIEWIHDLHPELAGLANAVGLTVTHHALMALTAHQPVHHAATNATVRIVDSDDPALLDAQAVAAVSFRAGGTTTGPEGAAERTLASDSITPETAAHVQNRARRRLTITAVAETSDGVVAAGSYQPMNQIAEIVAVSTLPAMRRQGLAGAVTARLVQHARDSGVQLLVLSAQNDQVARVYQRIGFHRIGTACAAEQPA